MFIFHWSSFFSTKIILSKVLIAVEQAENARDVQTVGISWDRWRCGMVNSGKYYSSVRDFKLFIRCVVCSCQYALISHFQSKYILTLLDYIFG